MIVALLNSTVCSSAMLACGRFSRDVAALDSEATARARRIADKLHGCLEAEVQSIRR